MRRAIARLAHDKRGAIAPTVALSLFALIAAGGLAFDYARLANLDTELQNAADQAALAAASQLDGQAGARARATAAASALLANVTLIEADLHSEFGIDLSDPALARRSWRWLQARIFGLLTTETRLVRALRPPERPGPDEDTRR